MEALTEIRNLKPDLPKPCYAAKTARSLTATEVATTLAELSWNLTAAKVWAGLWSVSR
jgi:hypothetical protein